MSYFTGDAERALMAFGRADYDASSGKKMEKRSICLSNLARTCLQYVAAGIMDFCAKGVGAQLCQVTEVNRG